ncbi:tetratricopeptide repeat protein [Prochlorococcus sp. MIT 0916]|uniref:Translation elongation factor P n=1 Tax=Prochlorococcus marinus str. P0903-H212 TaxID=1622208 RepID=A0A0D5A4G5_PROMR|nr:Translation elongation factor P [Prochlorococcus marinus str. P0903-H212]
MGGSSQEGEGKKKVTEVKIFNVPFNLKDIKENITITTNTLSKPSKEQLINQAFKFHSQGNISEAAKYYQDFINQGFSDYRVFCNYGNILRDLGKLKEAELTQLKAIEINPDFAITHYNLGLILNDLGKSKEAELSTRKAIEINPDFADTHFHLGSILRNLGKLKEAELSTRKAIELNPDFADAHSNLGGILRDLGNLQEAERSTRKAIQLNPDLADAHSNLGIILKDLGQLQEAEISYHKVIELKPDYAGAYFSLSTLQYSNKNTIWKDKLFSQSILNNKSKKDQIDIYFARANILHKEKNYADSAKYLQLANHIKLDLNPSNSNLLINKSKILLLESDKKEINTKEQRHSSESIFIVGMPRSGSTLIESIICMSNDVYDLGEINILEESFLECKKSKQDINLAELYGGKIRNKTELHITTNKLLYNYQYAGIIVKQIPNAKIIHCYRNPLDNILSIYRTNFAKGNAYSSSLVDCTRVYLDQENIMTEYKNRFRSKIYDLNYDSLVTNPNQQIKDLISWLGWKWQESYLQSHVNPRSVSTASSVQVRFPINSKSIDGWKNYKDMLKPAIEILAKTNRYKDIAS